MQKAVEKYARKRSEEAGNRKAVKIIDNLVKSGYPFESALECAKMDLQTYQKYKENN